MTHAFAMKEIALQAGVSQPLMDLREVDPCQLVDS